MQLYHVTCTRIFRVQDRAFPPGGYCCAGCCPFFIYNLREKSVSLTKQSGTARFKNPCGTLVASAALAPSPFLFPSSPMRLSPLPQLPGLVRGMPSREGSPHKCPSLCSRSCHLLLLLSNHHFVFFGTYFFTLKTFYNIITHYHGHIPEMLVHLKLYL